MNYVIIILVCICGVIDLRKRRIPNNITFPLIVIALGYNIFTGNYVTSLIGLIVAIFIGIILFMANGIGGGDVKLLAAIGAFSGVIPFFNVIFIASILSILWSVGMLLRKTITKNSIENTDAPFGLCLAIAFSYVTFFNFNLLSMFT